MVESPAVGAPQVGGLPDVVPEGTLLNMVLKRMHRPRCCSYQLVFEHRRPSCIQGLRWVSTCHLPGWVRAGGVVLAGQAAFSRANSSEWIEGRQVWWQCVWLVTQRACMPGAHGTLCCPTQPPVGELYHLSITSLCQAWTYMFEFFL